MYGELEYGWDCGRVIMLITKIPQCPKYHTVLRIICIEAYNGGGNNLRACEFDILIVRV